MTKSDLTLTILGWTMLQHSPSQVGPRVHWLDIAISRFDHHGQLAFTESQQQAQTM